MKDTLQLIRHLVRAYPRRSALIVLLSVLAGFAEGVGIASLLPLLEVTTGPTEGSESALLQLVRGGLDLVGLEPTIGTLLVVLVTGMFLKGAFLWMSSRHVGYTVAHVATDLRLMLIRALLNAQWGYFVTQRAGHLSNAVGMEAHRASNAYSAACALLAVIVQAVIYMGAAFLIAPAVALGALVTGAALAYLFGGLVNMSKDAGKRQTRLIKSLSARLVDALNGLKPIKAMAQEAHLQPLLEAETRDLNEAQRRQVLATGTMNAFHEPLLILILAAGLFAVLTFTSVALSGLLVMIFLFQRLVSRIHLMQMQYQSLVVAESAYWSLREAADLAETQRERSVGQQVPEFNRSIRLEDVSFGYTDQDVLSHIDLEIPAGEFVAIVGPSGAGKTTIVDLIIGLYQPRTGAVYIDDVPVSDLDVVAWRSLIGYVPQEMLLFHDSIYQNVTLGDGDVDRDDVMDALAAAGASDFIASLPDGIDTVIGERGARLSGGQRQRVAIARALLRKPKLLVLDEVTTALDPETEAAICRTLQSLPGNVTILSISHQPAMTRAADIVYHLEGGALRLREGTTPAEQIA